MTTPPAPNRDQTLAGWIRSPQGAGVRAGIALLAVFAISSAFLAVLLFPLERLALGFFTFFCMICFLGIPFALAIIVDAVDHAED
ncbi:MAG: hypothetical protein GY715_08695 [Planctomycetes bacterium]|nr:hypothetical protein [Planctomycetota bacterium]